LLEICIVKISQKHDYYSLIGLSGKEKKSDGLFKVRSQIEIILGFPNTSRPVISKSIWKFWKQSVGNSIKFNV